MQTPKITAMLCCFILCLAAAATAQPRWGRDRMPREGACFFADTNFRGDRFCVGRGEQLRSIPKDMSDKISSIRVVGAQVTVYRDSEMHGRSARFIGDVADLKEEGWNDQISSIDVAPPAFSSPWVDDRAPVWGREQLPSEGACFYQDTEFRGEYFCAPRGATFRALPKGFNDKISSIRVFDTEVKIFKDSKFHGKSTEILADVPDLRGRWSDTVSSIRVF
jgi:hypothetical protein